MLSVKSVFGGGSNGGGDNSLWAERYSPKQQSSKSNPYTKSVQLSELINFHVNYDKSNEKVIPEISLTTERYSVVDPFVKVVEGYSNYNAEVIYG